VPILDDPRKELNPIAADIPGLGPEALQQIDPSLAGSTSITEPLQPVQTNPVDAVNDDNNGNGNNDDKKDKNKDRKKDRGRKKNKDNPDETERALIAVSSIGM